jgi:hypothetical protein
VQKVLVEFKEDLFMVQMTFQEFLTWLVSACGASMAASWLLSKWAWFEAQTASMKQYVFFGASAVLAGIAYYLEMYQSAFVTSFDPIFMMLAGLFGTIFLGSAFHYMTKLNK